MTDGRTSRIQLIHGSLCFNIDTIRYGVLWVGGGLLFCFVCSYISIILPVALAFAAYFRLRVDGWKNVAVLFRLVYSTTPYRIAHML